MTLKIESAGDRAKALVRKWVSSTEKFGSPTKESIEYLTHLVEIEVNLALTTSVAIPSSEFNHAREPGTIKLEEHKPKPVRQSRAKYVVGAVIYHVWNAVAIACMGVALIFVGVFAAMCAFYSFCASCYDTYYSPAEQEKDERARYYNRVI